MLLVNPRKRVLVDAEDVSLCQRRRFVRYDPVARECARLVTNDAKLGERHLILELDKTFSIGRASSNDYQLSDRSVSHTHALVSCLASDTGQVVACLRDVSSNGTLHNDRKLAKSAVILQSGDRIEIGHQVFKFFQAENAGSHFVNVGDYAVLPCTLGTGAFATVVLAFDLKRLKQVACKKMIKKAVGEQNLASVTREVEMLKKASHPNINKIVDVQVSDGVVHIFLELVSGGDLFSYLAKKGRLDAPEAKWVLYQVLQALAYLHERLQVAHRDIKLENVVLCDAGPFPKIQLADFGQADVANRDFQSLKGTLSYMAPEQLTGWTRRRGYDGKAADMWSTGVLLSFLLIGGHPFEPQPLASSSSSSPSHTQTRRGAGEGGRGRGGRTRRRGNSIFGPSAAGEFGGPDNDNDIERGVCLGVIQGRVALPRFRFGTHDTLVRNLLSSLMNPQARDRVTAQEALEANWFRVSGRHLQELYVRVVGVPPPLD